MRLQQLKMPKKTQTDHIQADLNYQRKNILERAKLKTDEQNIHVEKISFTRFLNV